LVSRLAEQKNNDKEERKEEEEEEEKERKAKSDPGSPDHPSLHPSTNVLSPVQYKYMNPASVMAPKTPLVLLHVQSRYALPLHSNLDK